MAPVTEIYEHESHDLVAVDIGDAELVVTAEHPFWVDGRGWVAAAELTVGQSGRTLDAGTLSVKSVRRLSGCLRVYNFEVAGTHTYFVGREGIVVHNACVAQGVKRLLTGEMGERLRFSTRTAAREAAERASPIRKAVMHKDGPGGPHFHPAVRSGGGKLKPHDHDHSFFPRRSL